MTVRVDDEAVGRISAMPAVRDAAGQGVRLTALWPLTDAMRMDNDAKYAENLQVRMTRMMARVLTGEDVTVPDAEFVYEGADEIPGRPQRIVDALLAANDAYDTMAEYRMTGDSGLVGEAAERLGAGWDDATAAEIVASIEANCSADDADDVPADDVPADSAATAADDVAVDALALRFARALAVCDALFGVIAAHTTAHAADNAGIADSRATAALPILLFVNELRERLSVPRICLTDDEYRQLLAARDSVISEGASDTLTATATVIAPLAAAEWERHYNDVTWDPDEAKRLAKEEDERKNKEALAAKFAHVKDDPSKLAVEL